MPQVVDFDGVLRYIPGTYSAFRIITDNPGPVPDFLVPLILGQADQGYPLDLATNADRFSSEASDPWLEATNTSAIAAQFGAGSELHTAATFAWRHGLGRAHVVALNALTRSKVVAISNGPVNQLYVRPKLWGAPPGWHRIRFASSIWSVQRVSTFTPLVANAASGGTRCYVRDGSWIRKGQTVVVGDNDSTNANYVVKAVGKEISSGQVRWYVDITTTFAAAYTTAQYAGLAIYEAAVRSSAAVSTANDLVAAINAEGTFAAEIHADNTGLPDSVASLVAFKDNSSWATVTDGTSPALATSDVTAFVTHMDAGGWESFIQRKRAVPRGYLLVSSSTTNHATMRDYSIAERTRGYPISVCFGVAWGDTSTSAGDSTSAVFRVASLDCQDCMLVANGHNKLAAYLSTAAAVFGRHMSGGINHNLTNDDFVGVEEWEVNWSRATAQLETLIRAGVITNRLLLRNGSSGWVISQGLNTLQNNAGLIWNTGDQSTAYIHQRDLADFTARTIVFDLDVQAVGADAIQDATIIQLIQGRVRRSLIPPGYVVGFTMGGVVLNEAGNGYEVRFTSRYPAPVDFITTLNNIQIGG